MRKAGGIITSSIVAAAATMMIRKDDAKLLTENGGPLSIMISWAKSLLHFMHFDKSRVALIQHI